MGFALFCFEASTHDLDIEDGRPITHFLTQALFLAAPVLWAFVLIRQPRSAVEGETILAQNSPMDLAARNWWRILLYLTPVLTGLLLFVETFRRNPAAIVSTTMNLSDAGLTGGAMFLIAACIASIRFTGGTLSRLGDGLRLGVSMFMSWEKIGSVVRTGDFYGFCAPGRDGVTISYVRVADADTRQWLDGALTEVGARVRVRPAPLDYALQFAAAVVSLGAILFGHWLYGGYRMDWQDVLLIETAIGYTSLALIEMLRGAGRIERLKPSLKSQTAASRDQHDA